MRECIYYIYLELENGSPYLSFTTFQRFDNVYLMLFKETVL